jgi:hypothetical protein
LEKAFVNRVNRRSDDVTEVSGCGQHVAQRAKPIAIAHLAFPRGFHVRGEARRRHRECAPSGASLSWFTDDVARAQSLSERDKFGHETPEGKFQDLVLCYLEALIVQISLTVACNAIHHLNQRCARWLLQTHDRVKTDSFGLTQEYLGLMLGAQRPSVSIAQQTLQVHHIHPRNDHRARS